MEGGAPPYYVEREGGHPTPSWKVIVSDNQVHYSKETFNTISDTTFTSSISQYVLDNREVYIL